MEFFCLLLLLTFLHARDVGYDFLLHLLYLAGYIGNHLVHLLLIVLVQLGDGESSNPSKDDESESIKPGANVGETPHGQAKLDTVNKIIKEEQAANFSDERVDASSNARRHFRDNPFWNGERKGGDDGKRI